MVLAEIIRATRGLNRTGPTGGETTMEQATLAKHIISLGKRDFDAVVTLVLSQVFKLNTVDVDGAGDAGSDLRCFVTKRQQLVWATTAIQKTVRASSWKQKALADAEKSVQKLRASQFFFLTSQGHPSGELRALEAEIQTEYGIGATCLGAQEIAGLIHEHGLIRDFAEAIALPLDVPPRSRPDRQEMLLHAFASLSDERKELRQGVFDDALLITVFESDTKLPRNLLVEQAARLLGLARESQDSLNKRVDSLLARGRLLKRNGCLELSPQDALDLQTSAGMYVKELELLASAQQQLLNDYGLTQWSPAESEQTAVLLSRYFVQHQLRIAERASLPLTKMTMSRQLGDPEQELFRLLKNAGLDTDRARQAIQDFVELASTRPLIRKLTRAVTYIATEGRSIPQACRALGAATWSDVRVTLDASVAIPYLCASLFGPTHGRFSLGANECLRTLRRLNAQLVMPYFYINETAAHLLLALNTPEGEQYAKAAEHSQNGFVAHYFQLKNSGAPIPATLPEFISVFSKTAVKGNGDRRERARLIMPDIQAVLQEYGVRFESIQIFPEGTPRYRKYRKPAEESFVHLLDQQQRSRRQNLISHDVSVLAFARKRVMENGDARMCVTWDRTMIAVAAEIGDSGWIVTPNEASDLVQSSVDFVDTQLTSLAHALAKVKRTPDEIGASILDRIANLSSAKLQDWQFRQEFDAFYQAVMDRIAKDPQSTGWVDTEVEAFLADYPAESEQDEIDVPE